VQENFLILKLRSGRPCPCPDLDSTKIFCVSSCRDIKEKSGIYIARTYAGKRHNFEVHGFLTALRGLQAGLR